MPRPLRVEFPDALYHVTARGVRQEAIVLDDHDRVRWIDYLKEAVRRFGLELYAFVLMDNHFHLFVSAPHANLGKAMQYLNGAYAMYFNTRHKHSGHLFERRYRGILIENRGHYTEVSRYIHLNPVRAGAASRPEEYPWSSYLGYHSGRMPLAWLNYDRVLAEFGQGKDARTRYREFVAEGVGKKLAPPWTKAIAGWILGSPKFAANVYKILASDLKDSRSDSRAAPTRKPVASTLNQIAGAVCAEFGKTPEGLKGCGRGSRIAPERHAFVFFARDRAGYSWESIAQYLGMKARSAVLYTGNQARTRMGKDEHFREKVNRVESLLLLGKV